MAIMLSRRDEEDLLRSSFINSMAKVSWENFCRCRVQIQVIGGVVNQVDFIRWTQVRSLVRVSSSPQSREGSRRRAQVMRRGCLS